MNRKQFARGLRTGIPISLGYLAVSFTMGITAKNAGLTAFQATLTSLLVNASAGQYAAFTMMAANSGFLELAIMEAVTNARYILMSCALSQKLPSTAKLWQRMTIGFNVNDEIFGMAIMEAVYYRTSVAARRAIGPSLTLQGMRGHRLCDSDAEIEAWITGAYPTQEELKESAERVVTDFSWKPCARAFLRQIETQRAR